MTFPGLRSLSPPSPRPIPDDVGDPRRQEDGSWVLTPELAEAVERSLIDYRRYPDKCQALLAEQARLGEKRAEVAVRVAMSECVAERIGQQAERMEDAGVPLWEVVLVGVGAGVGGVVVGVVVGFLASRTSN